MRPRRRAALLFAMLLVVVPLTPFITETAASAALGPCPNGRTMDVIAHEDDGLLFMNPDLLHDIQAGRCVRTVVLTAGDNGSGQTYWQNRELGLEAGIAQMAGVANAWTTADAGVSGHPIRLATLTAAPSLSVAFMRLPDGNFDGTGFASTRFETLQKLWTDAITSVSAIDGSTSYTRQGLTDTLAALMTSAQPSRIDTQNYVGTFSADDHSDHYATAAFTLAAHHEYTTQHVLVGYEGYGTQTRPANVAGADLNAKEAAFFTYTPFDPNVCQNITACAGPYANWIEREYTVGTEAGGMAPAAVTVSPGSLAFGSVTVGTTVSATLTLTNTGDTTATVSAVTPPAAPFADATPLTNATVVAPGATVTQTVTFHPVATGPASGSYAFTISDATGSRTIALSGTGVTAPHRSGYWMAGVDGTVYAFGGAANLGNAPAAVHLDSTPSGNGYWIVDAQGNVYAFGDAAYLGGINGALSPGETVTSISATRSGHGYWLFTTLGRVVAYGDAPFLGDMSGTHLNGPVTGSIATASGHGYYMVASDGGIFTFGDAQFYGSMGATKLNAPVRSLVPDADGTGYWLVASDGGIFAFQANFYGSMGATKLNKPITGMVASGTAGYLMVAEDGGIFAFGTADFHGSLGNNPPALPITSVAALPS